MEEIWSLDSNMDEIALKRLEDGTWMFKAGQQGEYGEPTVFLDRKQLKDLHDAIEHELHPERFIKSKDDRQEKLRTVIGLLGGMGFTDEERNHVILRSKQIAFSTTDPSIIAYEERVENINRIFELMNELGLPEDEINKILDRIQIVEHEKRRGR